MDTPTLYRSMVEADTTQTLGVAKSYVDTLTTEAGRGPMRSAYVALARLVAPEAKWTWDTAQCIPWHTITVEGAGDLRKRIAQEVASGSVSTCAAARWLCAVRGAIRQAWVLGAMDADTMHRLHVCLKNIPGTHLPSGRHVLAAELARLFTVLAQDTTPSGRRDAACVALGAVGLRRAEIVGLDRGDLTHHPGGEGGTLRVKGKGGKVRLVHVTNGAFLALLDYLAHRGDTPGPLFLTHHRGYKSTPTRITPTGLRHTLFKRVAQATCPPFTWHDLRRTFAGNALDAGIDLPTVQAIMGHESPSTTARYDRRPEAKRLAAMRTIPVPYISPSVNR